MPAEIHGSMFIAYFIRDLHTYLKKLVLTLNEFLILLFSLVVEFHVLSNKNMCSNLVTYQTLTNFS